MTSRSFTNTTALMRTSPISIMRRFPNWGCSSFSTRTRCFGRFSWRQWISPLSIHSRMMSGFARLPRSRKLVSTPRIMMSLLQRERQISWASTEIGFDLSVPPILFTMSMWIQR
nr:putative integron gene cassette protein [uncultured bacterium]